MPGYSNEILKRWQAGVAVRVLVDTRANDAHPDNAAILAQLKDAGIPMRHKTSSGILHRKTMLFDAQNVLQFSGANFSPYTFAPIDPYVNYEDEVILFLDGAESPTVVNSFRTAFEDLWTDTSRYSNYANITGPLLRLDAVYEKDPELNFPAAESYRNRAIAAYDAETIRIDVSMFRITDRTHTDAIIRAVNRGIPVRLLTDETEYRNDQRLWHAWNVDRMYMAGEVARARGLPGIDLHFDAHQNVMHQKTVLLYSQGLSIFGSSNWTSPSAGGSSGSQDENNYFTTRVPFFNWFVDQFERKWNNTNPVGVIESKPFVPLRPDKAAVVSPADLAAGLGTSVDLTWYGGPWAHRYDIYLGTDPAALAPVAVDLSLGPSGSAAAYQRFTVNGLSGSTTYYWSIVSKTMARVARSSSVWSFTTADAGPAPPSPLPAPWQSLDIGTTTAGSAEAGGGVYTVRGAGSDIWDTADAFHFVYRTLTGDGTVTARVASEDNTASWAKAGVMMRESLNDDATYAAVLVTPGKGLVTQRRTLTADVSTSTAAGGGAAPYWVRLVRQGSTFSGFVSADGAAWTFVGAETIPMAAGIYVGLPVSSHRTGVLNTTTFDNVVVTSSADVSDTTAPAAAITQPADGDTVAGTAVIVADASDDVGVERVEFRVDGLLAATDTTAPYEFAWNTSTAADGSHTLEARAFDAAGNAGSSAPVVVTVANGGTIAALPAPWTGADVGSVGTPGTAGEDGGTFSVRGSGADVWGTADAFHFVYQPLEGNGQIVARVASVQPVAAWTKAGVMMRESLNAGAPHAFMVVSSGKGLAFQRRTAAGGVSTNTSGGAWTAPYFVKLARAGDTITASISGDGATWTVVGRDTIPMAASMLVGLAVSSHDNGAAATAAFDGVAVTSGGDATAPSVAVTQPAGGGTIAGTATVAADASDDVGVERVELRIDGVLFATDPAAPYDFLWDTSTVADGSHVLEARAYDAAGNTASSPAIVVSVANGAAAALPAPWTEADVGSVGLPGAASAAGGTFTVDGAGADIWGTADAFHFVYQPLIGDGQVVARVATVEGAEAWTKAGVMIREALDGGSRHALMLVSPGKGLAFQRRTAPGSVSTNTSGGAGTAPAWIKLVRAGEIVSAYRSADGAAWTFVGSDTIRMARPVLAGVVVSSHHAGTLARGTFESAAVEAAPPAP